MGRIGPRRHSRTLVLVVALAFAGTACSLGGAEKPAGPTRPALARGTLRLALIVPTSLDDPAILDPARPYDPFGRIDPEILRCCLLRTLLSYSGHPTEEGGTELHPDLAAAMPQVSRDQLSWTFRLKRGIRYAPPLERTSIEAADVVRAVERTATAEVSGGSYSTYYSVIQGYDAFARGQTDTISGLEIVDEHTVAVHLTEVTNDFGYRMALPGSAPIPAIPGDATAPLGVAHGHDDGYGPYLVASGPYMVQGAERLDPAEPAAAQPRAPGLTLGSLTLVRNPSWTRSTDDLRRAYVDRIEFLSMTRPEAERGIDEGTVDGIFDATNSREQVERYLADPELAPRVGSVPFDFFVGYTAMNLAVPPFDDVHVRRAVNLAYDADRWARIGSRHLDLSGGDFGFGTFGHLAPDGIEADLLRGERLYPFDVAAAHAEMARSGYDGNGDGVCDNPACRHIFALETDTGFEKFTDRVWVEGLKQIGITLDIHRIGDLDTYNQMSLDPSRRIPLNLGAFWLADYPNASVMFTTLFTAEGIGGVSQGNESLVGARPDQLERWGYGVTRVPNVDAKLDECLALIGFDQTLCWAELDQQLMTKVVPWVPQNTLYGVGISSKRFVRFKWDQALGTWPALDQIALARGST